MVSPAQVGAAREHNGQCTDLAASRARAMQGTGRAPRRYSVFDLALQ